MVVRTYDNRNMGLLLPVQCNTQAEIIYVCKNQISWCVYIFPRAWKTQHMCGDFFNKKGALFFLHVIPKICPFCYHFIQQPTAGRESDL